MRCDICYRELDSEKELMVHKKYFHGVSQNGQRSQAVASGSCPDCGCTLFYQEGCVKCQSCGYSKC